jgi:hypothetical protein
MKNSKTIYLDFRIFEKDIIVRLTDEFAILQECEVSKKLYKKIQEELPNGVWAVNDNRFKSGFRFEDWENNSI